MANGSIEVTVHVTSEMREQFDRIERLIQNSPERGEQGIGVAALLVAAVAASGVRRPVSRRSLLGLGWLRGHRGK